MACEACDRAHRKRCGPEQLVSGCRKHSSDSVAHVVRLRNFSSGANVVGTSVYCFFLEPAWFSGCALSGTLACMSDHRYGLISEDSVEPKPPSRTDSRVVRGVSAHAAALGCRCC